MFMSLWNHYSHFTPAVYARFNDAGWVGEPFPLHLGQLMLKANWIFSRIFPYFMRRCINRNGRVSLYLD
jgi:hypothetical protein